MYNDIVHSGGNLTELGDDIGYWTKDLIENFYAQLKENPLVVAEMNNNLKTVAAWDLLSHRELSGSAGEFIPNHPFAINLDYLRVYGLDTRHEIYGDDSWFDFKSYFEYGEGAIKLSNYSSYGIATEEASIIRRWTRGKKINTAILDNVQNGTPFTLWEVSFKKLLKDVLQKLPDNESTVIYRATSRSDIPSWSEQDLITYETFMATSESGEDLAFIIDNYPDLVQGYHTIFIIENGTNGKLIKDFSAYAGEGEILHNIEETNKLRVLEILENQPHPLAEFITKPENNIPVRVIRLSQE